MIGTEKQPNAAKMWKFLVRQGCLTSLQYSREPCRQKFYVKTFDIIVFGEKKGFYWDQA